MTDRNRLQSENGVRPAEGLPTWEDINCERDEIRKCQWLADGKCLRSYYGVEPLPADNCGVRVEGDHLIWVGGACLVASVVAATEDIKVNTRTWLTVAAESNKVVIDQPLRLVLNALGWPGRSRDEEWADNRIREIMQKREQDARARERKIKEAAEKDAAERKKSADKAAVRSLTSPLVALDVADFQAFLKAYQSLGGDASIESLASMGFKRLYHLKHVGAISAERIQRVLRASGYEVAD